MPPTSCFFDAGGNPETPVCFFRPSVTHPHCIPPEDNRLIKGPPTNRAGQPIPPPPPIFFPKPATAPPLTLPHSTRAWAGWMPSIGLSLLTTRLIPLSPPRQQARQDEGVGHEEVGHEEVEHANCRYFTLVFCVLKQKGKEGGGGGVLIRGRGQDDASLGCW